MSERAERPGERAQRLMMARLDGEASSEERAELERLLEGDPALRAEWRRLQRVHEITEGMALSRPPDEVWDTYWESVYRRLERGIGWILTSIGAIVLIVYGLWKAVGDMLRDAGLPAFVKGAALALIAGGVVLLVSVAREKLHVWKSDPYRDVKR